MIFFAGAVDGVQPKIPPSISFSGTERKQFLLCRNCFRYVPDNEIEGDILGWTTSYSDGDNEDGTKRLHAIFLIMSADSDQYSGIWKNLKNSTLLGTENYTKTTTAAYNVLCRYKKPAPPRQVHTPPAAVMVFG